jgi:uncharacterized protein (DUF302 family)
VAFEVVSPLGYTEAVVRARAALAAEGFGVQSEIDVQATLRAKLGVEREPYLILGACHAPSADQALQAAPDIGVLLPCNVTVSREGGRTVVRALDPDAVMGVLGKPELASVGAHVSAALQRVLAACERES